MDSSADGFVLVSGDEAVAKQFRMLPLETGEFTRLGRSCLAAADSRIELEQVGLQVFGATVLLSVLGEHVCIGKKDGRRFATDKGHQYRLQPGEKLFLYDVGQASIGQFTLMKAPNSSSPVSSPHKTKKVSPSASADSFANDTSPVVKRLKMDSNNSLTRVSSGGKMNNNSNNANTTNNNSNNASTTNHNSAPSTPSMGSGGSIFPLLLDSSPLGSPVVLQAPTLSFTAALEKVQREAQEMIRAAEEAKKEAERKIQQQNQLEQRLLQQQAEANRLKMQLADKERREKEEAREKERREKEEQQMKHMQHVMHVKKEGGADEPALPYPAYWAPIGPTTANHVVHDVMQGTEEFQCVADRFRHTVPNTQVKKVERVQNRKLWKWYSLKKHEIEEENGAAFTNEKMLFHGSEVDKVPTLVKDGLDMRVANLQGAIGAGIYFAEDAVTSVPYVQTTKHSGSVLLKMLLCRVVLGSFTPGSQGLRRPPPKNAHNPANGFFDSVEGVLNGRKTYCIFDNNQSYPEYIVSYVNVGKGHPGGY